MRRILAVTVALALCWTVAAVPATAEPASSSSASAYGLSASGLIPISPTITGQASQPPGQDLAVPPQLLNVPLGGLALAGVVGVDARAHSADDITPLLVGIPTTANASDPTTITPVNAQAVAKTTGAALVFNNPGLDPIRVLLAQVSTAVGGLLGADAVVAEAVARCVNNEPVFETGFQVAGLGGLVGDALDPIVQPLLDQLLGLLGPGSTLSSIISIDAGRVTRLTDGIAIDGLVVRVPLLNQEIIISHAEAHMPSNCGIAPPQPTGPGDIAPVGSLASQGRAAQPSLAATGTDVAFLPLGVGMIGIAFLVLRMTRRSSRTPVR